MSGKCVCLEESKVGRSERIRERVEVRSVHFSGRTDGKIIEGRWKL